MRYNDAQKELIRRVVPHEINFDKLSDDDYLDIEDHVGQHYTECVMDGNTSEADICEQILDNLDNME